MLTDGDFFTIYQRQLTCFLQYFDPLVAPNFQPIINQSFAEMIDLGLYTIGILGYPSYYQSFVQALEKSLQPVCVIEAGFYQQVQYLLEVLLSKK